LKVNDAGIIETGNWCSITPVRGVEKLAVGKTPEQVPKIASRVCGICPIAHTLAATEAMEASIKCEIPKDAKLLRYILQLANRLHSIALHDILAFLDADTLVPLELLLRIAQAMTDPTCVGGAVDCLHQSKRLLLRAYLKFWRVVGLIGGMAQGGCQFCRRNVFQELGGYDETWYMGEDVDFYWRLKRLARHRGLRTSFIRELQVVPSPRRWDRWPFWRILIWTCPLLTYAFRHRRSAWAGW
jgi:hypothetical protein